jgi:hypothetical protein
MMTICKKCDHHFGVVWGYSAFTDLCRAKPLPSKIDPITGKDHEMFGFEACSKINTVGACPFYKEKQPELPKPKKKGWFHGLFR